MTLDRFLTLAEVADRMQWSVRSVTRALTRHRIATVGRGRLARLSEADFQRLIDAERQPLEPEHPPPERTIRQVRDMLWRGNRIRMGRAQAAEIRAQIDKKRR